MDAIFACQTLDHAGRHLKTTKRISSHVNGHRSFDLRLMNGAVHGGGGGGGVSGALFTPSWTDPYSILYSNVGDLGYYLQQQQQQQTPLLSLPPLPYSNSYNNNIESLSYSPLNNSKGNRKTNRFSYSSSSTRISRVPSFLPPQKSSPKPKPHLKKDQKDTSKPAVSPRPDPTELPQNGSKGNLDSGKKQVASSNVEFAGSSIYILAPPPSSLPLPSFTLRSKPGCNAEAAASGICTDDGLHGRDRCSQSGRAGS